MAFHLNTGGRYQSHTDQLGTYEHLQRAHRPPLYSAIWTGTDDHLGGATFIVTLVYWTLEDVHSTTDSWSRISPQRAHAEISHGSMDWQRH